MSAVTKVAIEQEAHGTEASMWVGNLAHFMHKIALFHKEQGTWSRGAG